MAERQITIAQVPWASAMDMLRSVRAKVFIEEQQIPREEEWDGQDDEATHFLAFLGGMKSIKIGRENPPLFWANTIDEIEVSEYKVTLRGVCSRHVSA